MQQVGKEKMQKIFCFCMENSSLWLVCKNL